MTKVNCASVTLALLMLALLAPAGAPAQTTTDEPALDAYEGLPLGFVANAGQTDERVRYLAHGAGYSFFFTDAEAVLAFAPGDDEAEGSGFALDLHFPGANPDASPAAGRRAAGSVTRFTGAGSDPQTAVATYRELTYRELWPKIDLVVGGEGGELAYEFHVEPGAELSDIRLAYAGTDGQSVDSDGDLVIHTPVGELTDTRPIAYQEVDGGRVSVESRHSLRADGHHGFAIDGDYDRDRPLVIRARLAYSSFVGGASGDSGRGVAVDAQGTVYVAGQTASADFPTTPGVYDRSYNQNTDAFVTKFDSNGSTIVYSTFLGGTAFDSANGIAVDDEGSAYIAGFTGSTNFPTTAGAFDPTHNGGSDAFVAKLSPSGSALEYSSYLGAGGFSFDGANGIAVDDEGSAYVIGFAGSGAFPTTPGAFDQSHNGRNDVYVSKFDPSGSALIYSSFLGGTLLDTGNAVAVDRDGYAYVTGITASADFPTTAEAPDHSHDGGGNDAFVTKLDPSGSAIAYSTFLGGAGSDAGQGIAVDDKGKAAHVAGSTSSSDFPTTDGAFDPSYNGNGDAFVTKLDRSGSLAYATFLGGTATDAGSGIAVDEKGKASYVTGSTDSGDLPTTDGAFDRSYNGGGDAFVAGFDRSGSALDYSTYLGGAANDAGLGIAVDEKGGAAYMTGSTQSSDYPTRAGAEDPSYNGAGDGILTKLAIEPGASADHRSHDD
jgi:hypothetical protein